jgi:alkylation response protein AidB-like acyl-CoA dehydrogenase
MSPHDDAGGQGGVFLTRDLLPSQIFTREDVSGEQRMFARTAADFMRREVLPHVDRLYAHDWGFTRELLRKAAELDLLRLEIPEQYGGLALDRVSSALVGEQIAVNPSFGGSLGAHTAIGTLPLVYFGSDAQKAQYLPKLASAEMIAAYALTEPGAGSDARAAKTTAVPSSDGRHYLLSGQKMWITNGGFADLFTVFAKVNGEAFTAFVVERSMGVKSGTDEHKLGLDGSSTTALLLDEVKVPADNVLGTIGEGHKVAFNVLNLGRVKLGARNMAGVRQALTHAARYASERRQFGRPIAEFGMIQQKLADMAVRVFVGDAMVFRALGAVDQALAAVDPADSARVLGVIEGFAAECSINKVFTSEALAFATDEALQVFGGNGYSREFPVERFYRDARITRIYEGTNEINRLLISTRLLKRHAAAPQDEDTRRPPPAGALVEEARLLDRLKALLRAMLHEAPVRYADRLKDEQELLGHLADLVADAYALESAIARSQKLALERGETAARPAIDMTRVFAGDIVGRAVHAARAIAAIFDGAPRAMLVSLIAAVAATPLTDVIASRRRIAADVMRHGGPPV